MTTPNIVSFNCRGLGNPLKLTSLIANTDINNDVIAIQETKLKKTKEKTFENTRVLRPELTNQKRAACCFCSKQNIT